MNNNIAVIICNWNKQEDVVKCINSVLNSSIKHFDLIVVDNASNDQSVQVIKKTFNNKLILIENEQNLGGSGGFNTGIKYALEKEYDYIHLLDNDVVVDKYALEKCYQFLLDNQNVAAVGSKILQMGNPNMIQELGSKIDWNNYSIIPQYKNAIDDERIPSLIECDYVPACSVMVRRKVIDQVGIMDNSCFIYWDDMDWFYRMKCEGYKVMAISDSKVWHKMGASTPVNTFVNYYYWRNRVNFFLTYLEQSQLQNFSNYIINEAYQAIFMCNSKGLHSIAKTIILAIEDALNGIRNKASEGKIFDRERIEIIIETKVGNTQQYQLLIDCESVTLEKVLKLLGENKIDNNENLPKLAICEHVTTSELQANVYIDKYLNILTKEELITYHTNKSLINNIYLPLFIMKAKKFKDTRGDYRGT